MKKRRYEVYTLLSSIPKGEDYIKPQSFDTMEQADEYAFVQKLSGYQVEINDTQRIPLKVDRSAELRKIVSRDV